MITYGSLFAGIGGFCLGMEQAGMRCAWRVEIDANCRRILARHWPGDHLHKDVRDFYATGSVIRPDIITAGFPCQDVSVAGKRAGLAGERSGLFHDAVRVLGEFRPAVVVIENVPGLLTSNKGRDMGTVVCALADLGYGVSWRVLDAQWFRVAQRRRRLFIVGVSGERVRRAAEILLEPESLPGDSAPGRAPRPRVAGPADGGADGDRRTGVVCDDVSDPISTREGKTWTCEGTNNFRTRNVVVYTKGRRAQSVNDHETWLDATNGVSPTLNQFDTGDTRATTAVVEQGGPTIRRLTPLECERLQGFPDAWTALDAAGAAISDAARYRALGNAVCVPVASWLGCRIVAAGKLRTAV